MIKKSLSVVLVGLLFLAVNFPTAVLAQTNVNDTPSNAAKIKAYILKRGIGEKRRVKVKMLDGTKIKGYFSQSGADSFTINDPKTKQPTIVAYRDVAQVKRDGLSTGANIGIAVGAGVGLTVAVIFIALAATGGSDILSR